MMGSRAMFCQAKPNHTSAQHKTKHHRMRWPSQITLWRFCTVVVIIAMATQTTLTMSTSPATWEYHWTGKRVDDSLSVTDIRAESLVSCASHCSRVQGSKIFSLYYVPGTRFCQCNSGLDESPDDSEAESLAYGVIDRAVKFGDSKTIVFPYQQDCLSLYNNGFNTDGVYVINPGGGVTTDTWCDMTNGGWTVILQRHDGSENFNRSWSEYESGFGNRSGEYWLGLQTINKLTLANSQLKIDMEAFPGESPQFENVYYENFMVGEMASDYRLTLSGFSGSCGDSMYDMVHPVKKFSTYDRDNDHSQDSMNCAEKYGAGWWFGWCHRGLLTGHYYQEGEYVPYYRGIMWPTCWGTYTSCKNARMRTRRV